jgi:type I restriction enzyme S subunit
MIGEGKTRGQAAILDIEATSNQNTAAILCARTKIPSEYIFYWLYYQYDETRRAGMGGMQPALNSIRVRNLPIPIAPLDEQYQITNKLNTTFSNIDYIEKQLKKNILISNSLKQSLLKKAFEGKLVPQDLNDEPASVLLERIKVQRVKQRKLI